MSILSQRASRVPRLAAFTWAHAWRRPAESVERFYWRLIAGLSGALCLFTSYYDVINHACKWMQALSGFPAWYFGEKERAAMASRGYCAATAASLSPKWRIFLETRKMGAFFWEQQPAFSHNWGCRFDTALFAWWMSLLLRHKHLLRLCTFSPGIVSFFWRRKYYCASAKQLVPVDCIDRITKRLFIRNPRLFPHKYIV